MILVSFFKIHDGVCDKNFVYRCHVHILSHPCLNIQFQHDLGSDLLLMNRFIFRKLQTFQNKTFQLIKDNTKFFAANLSRVFVDGYFWGEHKTESWAKTKIEFM